MISLNKLLKMARKWQRQAAPRKIRITLPEARNMNNMSSVASKGHFVVYTADQKRFVFPIAYLNNQMFQQLLTMSEEEFGLPSNGPITLPCDSVFMEYVVSLMHKRVGRELEMDLIMSLASSRCFLPSSVQGQHCRQMHPISSC